MIQTKRTVCKLSENLEVRLIEDIKLLAKIQRQRKAVERKLFLKKHADKIADKKIEKAKSHKKFTKGELVDIAETLLGTEIDAGLIVGLLLVSLQQKPEVEAKFKAKGDKAIADYKEAKKAKKKSKAVKTQ